MAPVSPKQIDTGAKTTTINTPRFHKKSTRPNPQLVSMLQVLSSCVNRSIAQPQKAPRKTPNTIWWGSRPNPETGVTETKTKSRIRSKPKDAGQFAGGSSAETNPIDTDGIPQDMDFSDSQAALSELQFEIECLREYVKPKSASRSWESRIQADGGNWEAVRGTIFQEMVKLERVPQSRIVCSTSDCTKAASICCTSCTNSYLCSDCDVSLHYMLPLHQRHGWPNGYWERLSCNNTVTCTEDGILSLEERACVFPLDCPQTCQHCGSSGCVTGNDDGNYILITTTGRYNVQKLKPLCDVCGEDNGSELSNVLRHGFWPANPRRFVHLFQVELLQLVDRLMLNLPGSSMSGIASTLREISSLNGMPMPVSPKLLATALSEFRFCQRELSMMRGSDVMNCPPCSIEQHSCHMDGNFKVYRYAKVPRGDRTPYYKNVFITDNNEVSKHDKDIAAIVRQKPQEQNNLCGSSYWKAARDTGYRGRDSLDETGLVVAGCRHAMASKAVNMFTGERFAYHHYLHIHHILQRKVQFMWQDVICKYWPWASRLAGQSELFQAAVSDVRPALSVMHAKAHAWDCQVLWSGVNQPGAGTTTGEDMEQFFSHLSRVGSTTKNMSASRREDTLTEHVLFWNERKIQNMPQLLVKKYNRVRLLHQQYHKELSNLTSSIPDAEKNRLMWKEEIQSLANGTPIIGQSGVNQQDQPSSCQLYKLHLKLKEAAALGAYTSQASNQTELILGQKTLLHSAKKQQQDLESMTKEYRSLTTQLTVTGESISVLLEEGREQACKQRLAGLDSRLDLLVVAVRQRKQAISKLADTSKQRTKLRRRNEKDVRALGEIVTERNEVNTMLTDRGDDISVQMLLSNSPQALPRSTVAFDMKKSIVDLYEKVDRLQEEELLLVREMKNFLAFFKNILYKLSNEKYQVHNCGNEEGCHHYCLNQVSISEECVQGLLGLKMKGISAAQQQLQNGLNTFSNVFGSDKFFYCTSSEDDSSDDSDNGEHS